MNDRETRNLEHKKQDKIETRNGYPSLSDMIDGVPQFRMISGELYFCTRRKNTIHYFHSGAKSISNVYSSPGSNHAAQHEVGGSDLVNHDSLTGFVANEHIDWTGATDDFETSGTATVGDGTNQMTVAADGEIGLEGTARVKKGIWIPFDGLRAPGTKPATFKEWGISGAWEFSDGTDDTIVFDFKVPEDMDRTVAPSLQFGWSTATAVITETAVWQLEYLWSAAGEDTTAAAQETLTVNSNAIALANGLIIAEITGIDVPSSTDICMHCRFKRLGADGDDDLTDTAELHGVCLSYTSNKLGTAT